MRKSSAASKPLALLLAVFLTIGVLPLSAFAEGEAIAPYGASITTQSPMPADATQIIVGVFLESPATELTGVEITGVASSGEYSVGQFGSGTVWSGGSATTIYFEVGENKSLNPKTWEIEVWIGDDDGLYDDNVDKVSAGSIVQEASGEAPPVSVSALLALCGEARDLTEETPVSLNGSDVDPDVLWTTQENLDRLKDAIKKAGRIIDNALDYSQTDINYGEADLQAAIDAFRDALKPGTDDGSSHIGGLESAIAEGERYLASMKISDDGKDVPPSELWLPTGFTNMLLILIDDAKGFLTPPVGYEQAVWDQWQNDVDTWTADILDEIEYLHQFERPGLMGTTVDAAKARLKKAMTAAVTAIDTTKVSADGKDVYAVEHWVTRNELDVSRLMMFFEIACDMYYRTGDSQDAINSVTDSLEDAVEEILSIRRPGTKPGDPSVGVSALAAAHSKGDGLLYSTKASADGSDVLTSEYWVTPEELDVFADALNEASAIIAANPDHTQDDFDAATVKLNAAIAVFELVRRPGTMNAAAPVNPNPVPDDNFDDEDDDRIPYNPNPDDDDDDDSDDDNDSSSGGGGGSSSAAAPSPTTSGNVATDGSVSRTTAVSEARAALNGAAANASVSVRNADSITTDTLRSLANEAAAAGKGLTVLADTATPGFGIEARLYLDPAAFANATGSINLGANTRGAAAEAAEERLEAMFNNGELAVIHFGQRAGFGAPIQVAARVDLTGLDTESLLFYAVNTSGDFAEVKTEYRIDSNGFLHFTTSLGFDIVVTDEPLVK